MLQKSKLPAGVELLCAGAQVAGLAHFCYNNLMIYLEALPLSSITKYSKGQPGDGVPFTGYARVHSTEKNKLILVNDPVGQPVLLEFKLDDILYVEEIPSAVTEAGEGVPMVKLWVQKGARGVILEPFEVGSFAQAAGKVRAVKEQILCTEKSAN